MTTVALQFLELLRSGLWGKEADASLFSADTDWKSIFKIAKEQTVLVLIADGYLTLPAELQPPKALQFQVEAFRTRMVNTHALLNKTLLEVEDLMHSSGIPTVLFKGQGLASNYINPLSRACGDIDLYVGEANLAKAKEVISSKGIVEEETHESSKHFSCELNGVSIELHRIAENLDGFIVNKRYQRWTVRHLLEDNQHVKWQLEDKTVNLPPTQFNIIYVFNHFFHHFQSSGVGLRQICDWARLLYTYKGCYDIKLLEADLRSFRLLSVFKTFTQIAVAYLGLAKEAAPFYDGSVGRRARKAIEMVFEYGNFGVVELSKRKPRPKSYYAGKLHSFKHALKNNCKLFKIFPLKTIIHFVHFTIYGTIVAIRHD